MRRLLLLTTGFLIFLAVAVPTAAVYYLLFTEGGFHLIVSRIPHRIGGTTLDIINAGGTVAQGIHVDRIVINHDLVHLEIDDIGGKVRLLPLLWQTIRSPD